MILNRSIALIFLSLNFVSYSQKENSTQKFVEVETSIINDFNINLNGGLKKGSALLGNIDLILNLNTEKAGMWKGGNFFINSSTNYGKPFSTFIGDIQISDNIEANNNTRLYQFGYSHEYKNFEMLIGQQDFNLHFAIPENGLSFIHSSFGLQPDLSTNITSSTFPLTTLGLIAKLNLKKIIIMAAAFNGSTGDEINNPHSLKWNINKTNGMMNIIEIKYKPKNKHKLISTFKFGLWNHTANTQSLNNKEIKYNNDQGAYIIIDAKLNRKPNKKEINGFLQLGAAPKDCNIIKYYTGLGINFTNLMLKNSELGLAVGTAFLNNVKPETVVEISYNVKILKDFTIQPDFQYIIHPSGLTTINNALVLNLRTKFIF